MHFHTHKYKFDCMVGYGHAHRLLGYAGSMIGIDGFHFHFFYGVCSYHDHTHYFAGITGMPVKTDHGHIHRMEGSLEHNNMHEHSFRGFTSEDITKTAFRQVASYGN